MGIMSQSEVQAAVLEDLTKIEGAEPEMAQAISMMVRQIAKCYGDKYAEGIKEGIDTKMMLYNPEHGEYINVYQMMRYFQRYLTKGQHKSHLLLDILKAAHYAMFEVVRRIRKGETDLVEPRK